LCTLSAGTYGTVVLKEGSQLAFEGMTLSQLAGRTCDSYRLNVDKSVADYVEIAVEAVPREDSLDAAGNKLLCRKFLFAEYGSSTTKWHGAFSETADDTYWAYNYEISGTSITDVVLMWNAEIIALSKWSVENLGGESYTEDVPDGWEAVKFSAGDNGISSYTVQFYRAEGNYSNESPDEDWASVKEISVDE
jgi:hypothetical protein